MKKSSHHRFEYRRFGEGLIERGLIEREALNHVLQQCANSRALLPEILVYESYVSDWEVSRVACELYHLPFLTVEVYPPDQEAVELFDPAFLHHYALVPLDRMGELVTVIMPGLVPSEVLEGLRTATKKMEQMRILPLVGSVASNRHWLTENLPLPATPAPAAGPQGAPQGGGGGGALDQNWVNIFDAGEEAVQNDLRSKG